MNRTSLLTPLLMLATVHTAMAQAQFVPLDVGLGASIDRLDGQGAAAVGNQGGEAMLLSLPCALQQLGVLPGYGGSVSSGVSNDGKSVVGTNFGSSANEQQAFRWDAASGMVGLGLGLGLSSASAVSADGSVVVGITDSPAMPNQAFRWTQASGMEVLGPLPAGTFGAFAQDVSADGLVIVGTASGQTGASVQVFRWTAGTGMVSLGAGQQPTVSGDGSVVVAGRLTGLCGFFSRTEATRWTAATGFVSLGMLPGDNSSLAVAVSEDGNTVLGVSRMCAMDNKPFLWTPSGGMVNLADHLSALGATGMAGWQLNFPLDISADGNAILGVGINPSGAMQEWVAYLTPPPSGSIGTRYCSPASASSTGVPASLSATGSVSASDNDLTLTAGQLPPGQFGYFLASQTQGMSVPAGSSGTLCLSGNIGRFNASGLIIQGPCGGIDVELTAIPVNPTGMVLPGDTWNFQCWYRDMGNTSNFTDAVSITFQ